MVEGLRQGSWEMRIIRHHGSGLLGTVAHITYRGPVILGKDMDEFGHQDGTFGVGGKTFVGLVKIFTSVHTTPPLFHCFGYF